MPAVAPAGQRKRFILELDHNSEPIVGSLCDAEGRSFEFTGWLGFSSALGRALQPVGKPSAKPERVEDE